MWVQVAATSWELPPAFVPLYAEFCANQALGDGARWTLYFALLHGEPVGISSVFYGHATAGLYHVGVAPAARKQGIGTQITLAPLRDAAAAAGERGAYVATLFSSPGAINLYRRLGFREYCRIGQCLFGGPSTGDVRQLQQILSRLGYDTGAADGIYGSRTSAAVRAFQAEHTLAADGSPRAQVRRVLEAALAVERARAENGRQRAARR